MKFKFLFSVLTGLTTGLTAFAATQSTYVVSGKATDPVIDATNVINRGEISVSSVQAPWDTQNTLNFTNVGVMQGSVGFRFDHVFFTNGVGYREASSNFINTGTIDAVDGGGVINFLRRGTRFNTAILFGDDRSTVEINANRVKNTGVLQAGSSGLISISGDKVDLSGGSTIISPALATDFFSNGFYLNETNFLADLGVFDQGWSIGTTTNFTPGAIVFGTTWFSPVILYTNFSQGFTVICPDVVTLTNPQVFAYSVDRNATQHIFQVVAVQTSDPKISSQVRFIPYVFPSDVVTQPPYTAVLEMKTLATDLITQQPYTNAIYVTDQIANSTNYNLLLNYNSATYRPAPLIVSRSSPLGFEGGRSPNIAFNPAIFDNTSYSNRVATNLYDSYIARIDNRGTRLPDLPDLSFRNQAGRVEITAKELDLNRARIRGEGLVSIRTDNFTGSSKAIVDGPNLRLNLATKLQSVQITNLTLPSVERLTGQIQTYSSSWTNTYVPTLVDPTDTNSPNIELIFQLLMVDASSLSTVLPVTVNEFTIKSPTNGHVQIGDQLNVTDVFKVESDSVTVSGALALSSGLRWDASTVPILLNLTNLGRLEFAEDVAFGSDRPGKPYKSFVNKGVIQAFSHSIDADYFENTGSIVSTQYFRLGFTNFCFNTVTYFTNVSSSIGPVAVNARQGYLNGGNFETDGEVSLTGEVWKFHNSAINAPGGIVMNVSGTLTDPGSALTVNNWITGRGIQMVGEARGDLLGTTILSVASPLAVIDHQWSALDLGGTNAAGFDNNLAVGRLILQSETNSIFRFAPSTSGRVLYVDLLDLSGPAFLSVQDVLDNLYLAPGFKIYFGDVKSADASINAESLDGLAVGDGSLVWVRTFAGAYSGVDVPLFGENRTIRVNGALRESLQIDTDGDGIPNGFDDYPFDPAVMRGLRILTEAPNRSVELTFDAAAGVRYELQFTENLENPRWTTVKPFYQEGQGRVEAVLVDDQHPSGPSGYYRLVYTP